LNLKTEERRSKKRASNDLADSKAHEMGKSQMVVTERLMAAMEATAEISKERMWNTVAQDAAHAEERNALFRELNVNSKSVK
jgi:hypothetical protein